MMPPLRMPVTPAGLRIVADWVPCGLCGAPLLYTTRSNRLSMPICGPCACGLLIELRQLQTEEKL
jgi:hypothetical protein